MSTTWNTRAEAWKARNHQTTIRRSRKGGDNSRVYRRGLAPVQGHHAVTDTDRWAQVPDDVSRAILGQLGQLHALILGTAGIDLTKLVDQYADVLGVEPVIGTDGVAYRQVFHVSKASQGADIFDAIALTAHRDDITAWASTRQIRREFGIYNEHEHKLEWPDRMTAGTARARQSESDIAGPRLPRHDGKLRRTGALYGASFVRPTRRYVAHEQGYPADQYGFVTMPRRTWVPATWYAISPNSTYGTRAGWSRIAGTWRVSVGVKSVKHHSWSGPHTAGAAGRGGPVVDRWLTVEDHPNQDTNERVFIGHRSIRRGPKVKASVKDARMADAVVITSPDQVRPFVNLVIPGTYATWRAARYEGTLTRSEAGRYNLVIRDETGRVVDKHRPRGAAGTAAYLLRYV